MILFFWKILSKKTLIIEASSRLRISGKIWGKAKVKSWFKNDDFMERGEEIVKLWSQVFKKWRTAKNKFTPPTLRNFKWPHLMNLWLRYQNNKDFWKSFFCKKYYVRKFFKFRLKQEKEGKYIYFKPIRTYLFKIASLVHSQALDVSELAHKGIFQFSWHSVNCFNTEIFDTMKKTSSI